MSANSPPEPPTMEGLPDPFNDMVGTVGLAAELAETNLRATIAELSAVSRYVSTYDGAMAVIERAVVDLSRNVMEPTKRKPSSTRKRKAPMMPAFQTHPDSEVQAAIIQLCDRLCMWERATGRESVLVLREQGGFCFRADSGKPLDDGLSDIPDQQLLDCVAS